MTAFFLLLYLLAGVFFGLAAGRVTTKRGLDFGWLGLLCWVTVEIIRTLSNM